MAVKYTIKAAVSEYKDKEGNQKKRYAQIGVVMETSHGLMMALEVLPVLAMKDGKILAYLNDPEQEPKQAPVKQDIQEDVPF